MLTSAMLQIITPDRHDPAVASAKMTGQVKQSSSLKILC
jgi:hypothetical protein